MALIGAFGDSNMAPKKGANLDENSGPAGNVGMLGYVQLPFPKEMPAQSNFDVSITKDLALSSVNQGTSLNSYRRQPAIPDPESGLSEAKTGSSDDFGPSTSPEAGAQAGDFTTEFGMASETDDESKGTGDDK